MQQTPTLAYLVYHHALYHTALRCSQPSKRSHEALCFIFIGARLEALRNCSLELLLDSRQPDSLSSHIQSISFRPAYHTYAGPADLSRGRSWTKQALQRASLLTSSSQGDFGLTVTQITPMRQEFWSIWQKRPLRSLSTDLAMRPDRNSTQKGGQDTLLLWPYSIFESLGWRKEPK